MAKWVNGQAPNLDLLLKSDNEAQVNYDFTVLASNDYSPAPGVRPQLQVTYTDGSHATALTVAVSAPAPGATVSGSTVTLSAAASSPGSVSKVQFFVDGSSVGSVSQAPWQVTWNSAGVGNGSHTITATATDSAGNSATSAGSAVTVNNYPSPTTAIMITSPANNARGLTGAAGKDARAAISTKAPPRRVGTSANIPPRNQRSARFSSPLEPVDPRPTVLDSPHLYSSAPLVAAFTVKSIPL